MGIPPPVWFATLALLLAVPLFLMGWKRDPASFASRALFLACGLASVGSGALVLWAAHGYSVGPVAVPPPREVVLGKMFSMSSGGYLPECLIGLACVGVGYFLWWKALFGPRNVDEED